MGNQGNGGMYGMQALHQYIDDSAFIGEYYKDKIFNMNKLHDIQPTHIVDYYKPVLTDIIMQHMLLGFGMNDITIDIHNDHLGYGTRQFCINRPINHVIYHCDSPFDSYLDGWSVCCPPSPTECISTYIDSTKYGALRIDKSVPKVSLNIKIKNKDKIFGKD